MNQILRIAEIVVPVFAVIGLGYFFAWTRVFSERAADGLSDYVFVVAIPLMIIRIFIEAKLPEGSPWGYWIAYFLGVAIVWAVGQTISAKLFHRRLREAVIYGFASSQSNVALLGIPLVLSAYGEAGAVPLFLLIAVHLPLMMIAATVMIEGGEAGLSVPSLKRFAWNMATNPILIGFFVGMLARYADVSLGGVPKTVIDMISASAVPCALFALGLALYRYGIAGDLTLSIVITALKLMLLPLIVWLLVRYVFQLSPLYAGVAVVFAAMPSGVNSYLLAERYKSGVVAAASAVSISSAASLFTAAFWLWVLGIGLN